ncbi:hypothetical protein [Desulfovibrio legallii]|jgi:hypothetical protein|uniref:Uncharacterized protein n=1 Tax=Desulfovibrio legallii TaxID=571438 RepID=A0A6H3F8V1_9BACT|nr:hypothetical protein [Desulfovibrio legallii]TBH79534.1 hypothetical protein EB812_08050 [Desulfovibrio legallii]DAZ80393.1 MAG TPA: helix-turn-helix, Psq domain [Caudoviricetes sp.]
MGREHEPGTVWEAQDLYCIDRLSFDAVAKKTGVAASTLKRWADRMDWRGKRERIAETESALRVDRVLARSQVLKKLLETGESQDAYAVAALERLALLQEENELRRAEREKDRRLRKAEKEREWKERRALAELRLSGARQNAGVTSPAVKPQDLPRNDEERAALLEDVINRRLSDLLSCPPENILRLMKDLNESRRLLTELRGGENADNGAVTVAWSDGQ